jgi:hypothetical protein
MMNWKGVFFLFKYAVIAKSHEQLSWRFLWEATKSHETPQPGPQVSGPRFEPGNSRTHVKSAVNTPLLGDYFTWNHDFLRFHRRFDFRHGLLQYCRTTSHDCLSCHAVQTGRYAKTFKSDPLYQSSEQIGRVADSFPGANRLEISSYQLPSA